MDGLKFGRNVVGGQQLCPHCLLSDCSLSGWETGSDELCTIFQLVLTHGILSGHRPHLLLYPVVNCLAFFQKLFSI